MALMYLRSASAALKASTVLRGRSIGASSIIINKMSTLDCNDICKSVFISQSHDVFTNLALEDWLYKNFDFTNHHVMLLWRNDPCVVVGKNQNPWIEANVDGLNSRGINLARRNSGGGTVYHDKGNLNITFFTPIKRYNRLQNLQLIEKTLQREWKLNIHINKREDLILDHKFKVSGTASKLGRLNAYHHCTLMVDVNKDDLFLALTKSQEDKFDTKALKSVGVEVENLGEAHTEIQMERLMERLGWEYLRTSPLRPRDAGWNLVSKQNGFQMINPTDQWFPGLAEIRDEFTSWSWKFGKTPSFTVERWLQVGGGKEVGLRIEVERGVVTNQVSMVLPEGLTWGSLSGTIPLQTTIVGQNYSTSLFQILENAITKQAIPFVQMQSKTVSVKQ